MARSIAEILVEARRGTARVAPRDLPGRLHDGARVIDVRTPWTRDAEGHIPGAIVVEHTVMLWRLDPVSPSRMADGPSYDDDVIVVCNEGFSSSLAARDLRELGFSRATDLEGGFRAWAEQGLPVEPEPTRYVT
ncbi:rhodanese-like domain-containing protein [Brachybacterium subflavum]|uniref:rhodanese-like domain-containing protein n=1 Tax=Brachybacterium subflavum TaxID=2585206 RepID=UPI0012661003|nr:rhodanese-like domain-containing protein [Brachybacterium subflavum]